MMKLISRWQNSAGERVRIALNLKSIPYQYVAAGTLPPGEYRRINPQGLLPTLEVDGRFVAQSAAILEFLEETNPQRPLLPADPIRRAEVRAFGAHIATEMHAITVSRVRQFLEADTGVTAAAVERWVAHWLTQGFVALDAALARRPVEWPFCFGETPGWADLHLIPQLAAARRLRFDLAPYRSLLAVEANCVSLDAFARARPEAQPDYPGRS
jgi:maleylacetoacetate isomerase